MKKKLVYLLAILTSFSSTVACMSHSKTNNKDDGKINGKLMINVKSPSWQKLSTIWKNLNKLYETQDYTIKQPLYKQVMDDYTAIDKLLAELTSKGILDAKQSNFLKQQFQYRYHSLPQRVGMATCYEIAPNAFQTSKTLDDLNKQYEALDKLAKENKINSQTYKNVKKNIINDIKEYKELQKTHDIIPEESLIDLLYILNR